MRFGAYPRKKAGVLIQRFKCSSCGRTFNFLPPFLLPHKHYTVPEMAPAIAAYALGETGQVKTWQTQESAECSLETFRRWVTCFRQLAPDLLRRVRKLLAELKPGWKFEKDRRLFTAAVPEVKEVLYQLFVLRDYFTSLITAEDYLPWLLFLRSTRFRADGKGLKRDNLSQPP